jgi:hypothetical protein
MLAQISEGVRMRLSQDGDLNLLRQSVRSIAAEHAPRLRGRTGVRAPEPHLTAQAVVDEVDDHTGGLQLIRTLTTTNQGGQVVLSGTATVGQPSASAQPGQGLEHRV